MNFKYKTAIVIGMCLMSTIIAGCGDKKEQAKADKPAQQTQQVQQARYGFISGNDVVLREGPSTSTKNTGLMNKGLKVEVLDTVKTSETDTWYKIKLADGKTGYVFGKFLKDTEAEAKAQVPETKSSSNGIAVPEGFKIERSGADYIVVRSAKENQMGGPVTMYKFDDTKFCTSVIKDCRGPRSIAGAYDGELVTIYKNGCVYVVTAIGGSDLQRYYGPGGSLVLFKTSDDNGGWRGTGGAGTCSSCNKPHVSRKYNLVYMATAREGVKATLSRWNSK